MAVEKKPGKRAPKKIVEAIRHEDRRTNIPTAEYQSVIEEADKSPVRVAYERRNRDLDPQLVWRGKDTQDWSDLVVPAPPLYIQEKVHPKVLIDDLLRRSKERTGATSAQPDLFADFNGIPEGVDRTEFYKHDQNWSNRMILGDSLQVMASLAEREGLRGKVQCIYIDPPYGIKFNSNFQWSTTSRDVKDGNAAHITREPEQVKAFRDTWRDGIHSYLTYLRDRLMVARDLLTESGSVFVQIGDENVHRVRVVMDEVFGETNFVNMIPFATTGGQSALGLGRVFDLVLWYARSASQAKFRQPYERRELRGGGGWSHSRARLPSGEKVSLGADEIARKVAAGEAIDPYYQDNLASQGATPDGLDRFDFQGATYRPPSNSHWKTHSVGMERLARAERIDASTNSIRYVRYLSDFSIEPLTNVWTDTTRAGYIEIKRYVVETSPKIIERCILMSTDPGDLVLDPTCGSGTTAYVAEQWGRRWITIDTSRVALALARARIMGARYPYYLLADSPEGQSKEAELKGTAPSSNPTYGSIRQGFVYERVPHITLKSIANNAEIDVIWEKWQATLEPLREKLNAALSQKWQEWEIPRESEPKWPDAARKLHADWWQARVARQKEIDASIAAKAEYEYLYDKPYQDGRKVRVAGPFTVDSLSPHRVLAVNEDDEFAEDVSERQFEYDALSTFPGMILENLRTAGVQQAHKGGRIAFTALTPWPGSFVCAEGLYREGEDGSGAERRAAIFIGPEFGTVTRPDLVEAAREAADGGFDVLIACAFNYDAHATEFAKLGKVPVLKARMNADLHMADDLKNTGKGNLFVIFGEPEIELTQEPDGRYRLKVIGVNIFKPSLGKVEWSTPDEIACWFVDTDYNEESFFVRHAYFLGANDPYGSLKTTLKAEIDEEAWATLHSDTSRPFPKPKSGRIAVKVINHLGDEVMKVFRVA
jgi:adenine-specific DNA-methyltransferase